MFQSLDSFFKVWTLEAGATQKMLNQLTDESLSQEVTPENWSLGRIAWHLVAVIGVSVSQTDLSMDAPTKDYPVPSSSRLIADSYQTVSSAFIEAIKNQWTDKSCSEVIEVFGQKMSKGDLLFFLIQHQTHHRAQMTVLMRQAGLSVPGLYGPSKEEWVQIGMKAPQM
jgi:uncharacterized damage-inducible protein DinB